MIRLFVKHHIGLKGSRRIFLFQLGTMIAVGVISTLCFNAKAGITVVLAGLSNAIPNACFAMMLFKNHGAKAARQITKGFYLGEALKMVLSIIMFAFIFIYCDVIPWLFFASYVIAQMVIWFSPLFFGKLDTPVRD